MTAAACAQRLLALYGREPREPGVLHVAAVWRAPSGALPCLRIGTRTPRSPSDGLALGAARARADAIVTTGRILREEPELVHHLAGDAELAASLADWRRVRLGRAGRATPVVLSSGRELPLAHPALRPRDGVHAIVISSHAGAQQLRRRGAEPDVRVVGRDAPSLLDAIEYLREHEGARTISVEAGPSSARALYDAPGRLDELLLSEYLGPRLDPALRGEAFATRERIEALLPQGSEPVIVEEESGAWRFQRRRAG